MSVLWLESGYMVTYIVSSWNIPRAPAFRIFLGLRLYFTVYPSSRHITDTLYLYTNSISPSWKYISIPSVFLCRQYHSMPHISLYADTTFLWQQYLNFSLSILSVNSLCLVENICICPKSWYLLTVYSYTLSTRIVFVFYEKLCL